MKTHWIGIGIAIAVLGSGVADAQRVCINHSEDSNADGQWTPGEPGLTAWPSRLENMFGQDLPPAQHLSSDSRTCWYLPAGQYRAFQQFPAGRNVSYVRLREVFETETVQYLQPLLSSASSEHFIDVDFQATESPDSIYVTFGYGLAEAVSGVSSDTIVGALDPRVIRPRETNSGISNTVPRNIDPEIINQIQPVRPSTTRTGQVCVVKFDDENGNGIQDAGEPRIPGWPFSIHDRNRTVASGRTDGSGVWCADVRPGNYWIAETVEHPWLNTEPGTYTDYETVELELDVQSGDEHRVAFGNCRSEDGETCIGYEPPENTGQICVRKFDDQNANGIQDAGEMWLDDWPFAIYDSANSVIATGQTDRDGRWCAPEPLSPGNYTVAEQMQSGWQITAPQGWNSGGGLAGIVVPLNAGDTRTIVFGNCREGRGECGTDRPDGPGEICIIKYHDQNGNGRRDAGEPLLPGWRVGVAPAGGGNGYQGYTDDEGRWCAPEPLPAGNYDIIEQMNPGWMNTEPGLSADPQGVVRDTVSLGTGQSLDYEFGNCRGRGERCRSAEPQPGELCVIKYDDLNSSGMREAGEPAIPSWPFSLLDASGAMVAQGQTDREGRWCLRENLSAGNYTVREVLPSDWWSTEPGGTPGSTVEQSVDVLPGQMTEVRFGNCWHDRMVRDRCLPVRFPELGITKELVSCDPAVPSCDFRITVTNAGAVRYYGGLLLSETLQTGSAAGLSVVQSNSGFNCSGSSPNWMCIQSGGSGYLDPGESESLTIRVSGISIQPNTPIENCAAVHPASYTQHSWFAALAAAGYPTADPTQGFGQAVTGFMQDRGLSTPAELQASLFGDWDPAGVANDVPVQGDACAQGHF